VRSEIAGLGGHDLDCSSGNLEGELAVRAGKNSLFSGNLDESPRYRIAGRTINYLAGNDVGWQGR
jgi:hypothetical protein